jgi:hypothetical protein
VEVIMAVVVNFDWDGVTLEQYEAVRKRVEWEVGRPPKNALFHVASFSDTGLHVTDLWESAEDFQAFLETWVMPRAKEAGIQGKPRIRIHPVHNLQIAQTF